MPHAMQIRQTGGPGVLNWTAVDVGEPGSGQVRMRQAGAGLNYIDVYHRTGYYPLPHDVTFGQAFGPVDPIAPVRERCALTSISALGSRMLQTPTRHWKRAQPRAPPS
jgi:NADPH:quinone reductase-like Zn-dependent oxidoreductase